MTTAIVLPQLSVWAVSHLTTLLQSKTVPAFETAFEATFAKDLDAVVNGNRVSRNGYKNFLLQQSGASGLQHTSVQVDGETQALNNNGQLVCAVDHLPTSPYVLVSCTHRMDWWEYSTRLSLTPTFLSLVHRPRIESPPRSI